MNLEKGSNEGAVTGAAGGVVNSTSRLADRDYYVVIDKSGSMADTDTPTRQTRWKYAEESAIAVARAVEPYDPDGITVVVFNGSFKVYDNTTAAKVKDIFAEHSPMGGTSMAAPLNAVFEHYLKNKQAGSAKKNGALCIVVTDGQPMDGNAVAAAISTFTKNLDRDDEFGMTFMQVGHDPEATRFLKKLDDDLVGAGAKFDIVDTKTIDEVEAIGLTEALIAALDD